MCSYCEKKKKKKNRNITNHQQSLALSLNCNYIHNRSVFRWLITSAPYPLFRSIVHAQIHVHHAVSHLTWSSLFPPFPPLAEDGIRGQDYAHAAPLIRFTCNPNELEGKLTLTTLQAMLKKLRCSLHCYTHGLIEVAFSILAQYYAMSLVTMPLDTSCV